MRLDTFTNVWQVEKRLYKLYDIRLPFPVPIVQAGVFVGAGLLWWLLLSVLPLTFTPDRLWLWATPPFAVAWAAGRPILEDKPVTALVCSFGRHYLFERAPLDRLRAPTRRGREGWTVVRAVLWAPNREAPASVEPLSAPADPADLGGGAFAAIRAHEPPQPHARPGPVSVARRERAIRPQRRMDGLRRHASECASPRDTIRTLRSADGLAVDVYGVVGSAGIGAGLSLLLGHIVAAHAAGATALIDMADHPLFLQQAGQQRGSTRSVLRAGDDPVRHLSCTATGLRLLPGQLHTDALTDEECRTVRTLLRGSFANLLVHQDPNRPLPPAESPSTIVVAAPATPAGLEGGEALIERLRAAGAAAVELVWLAVDGQNGVRPRALAGVSEQVAGTTVLCADRVVEHGGPPARMHPANREALSRLAARCAAGGALAEPVGCGRTGRR